MKSKLVSRIYFMVGPTANVILIARLGQVKDYIALLFSVDAWCL